MQAMMRVIISRMMRSIGEMRKERKPDAIIFSSRFFLTR
jgi:hypothetical protein